uniref:Ig-like domain-containing protein n=1 Tax=Sphaeramia orbicularis TaxID=375764 RepID=A0A673C7S8_9TELE
VSCCLLNSAKIECPLEINPDRMLLQYQGMEKNVTCKTLTSSENVRDQYWQISGISISRKAWTPDTQNDWDPSPACFATFVGREPCNKSLNFTLYKEPDSVSIRVLNNESSPVEGSDCFLRCDVVNFAPAQSLRVQWYQGNKTMEGLTSKESCYTQQTSFCGSANCDINTIKTPVNMSFTTTITLDKKHNGAEFRCKAVMDLELEDPPNMTSSPINVTVHCKITFIFAAKYLQLREQCQINPPLIQQSSQRQSQYSEVILKSLSVKLKGTHLQRSSGSPTQTKYFKCLEVCSLLMKPACTTVMLRMTLTPPPTRLW